MTGRRDAEDAGLERLAARAVEHARKSGASEAAAVARRGRAVSVSYRESKPELLREAQSAAVSISLYVDGRYSSHGTTDLRPEALEGFIERAIRLTRLLEEDPHRGLADPALYEDRPSGDLGVWDSGYGELDPEKRKELAGRAEAAARGAPGPIVSATGSYTDTRSEMARVHSNGFSGTHRGTQYWLGAEVTARDEGDRRPEDWHFAGCRHLADLPAAAEVGLTAAKRALSRLGQKKLRSGTMKVLVDSRVAGRLVGAVLSALSGAALQQRRSFLLDRLGERIGSPHFSLVDEPALVGGFGSRHFDGDGISARRRALVHEGTLEQYLIDVYYARKLGTEPTGGGISNLLLQPGERAVESLVADIDEGVYVTGILGGNSDGTTGDFSHGIAGFEIEGGSIGGPVGEMNITGSHKDLWERLVAVGDDPYPYSSHRLPSLLFDGVSVSGG